MRSHPRLAGLPFRLLAAILVAGTLLSTQARPAEARNLTFIRDAEIEAIIRLYSGPVFEAAGLAPEAVRIYLVRDNALNAFVAGGQNLFLNTGLIMRSEHAGQLIGVIAHEAGHIAGGHLSRTHAAMKDASAATIVSSVLGVLVGVGSGNADAAGAIILGGQSAGQRTFLRYSQTQESAADQAAYTFLDRVGWSAEGLYEFMGFLADQELLTASRQDPYLRTHPFSRDRVESARAHMARSPHTQADLPPEFAELHRRMRAKLFAFLQSPETTLLRYKRNDASLEARYARAIAYYRGVQLEEALPLVDSLIEERPSDPYFQELKGQMLFENGRVAEALEPYRKAVKLSPAAAQLRVSLARVEVELGDPALLEDAETHLRAALFRERNVASTWRLLAIVQGRRGDEAMAALSLAEEAMIQGKMDIARYQAGKAERLLPRGSRGWLQAQDILAVAEKKKKK